MPDLLWDQGRCSSSLDMFLLQLTMGLGTEGPSASDFCGVSVLQGHLTQRPLGRLKAKGTYKEQARVTQQAEGPPIIYTVIQEPKSTCQCLL